MATQRVLPLLYINMGAEMLYILEQRLVVSSHSLAISHVGEKKADKVLSEIACAMFSEDAFSVYFRMNTIISKSKLKEIFTQLAHSSIMRLNDTSMDKLFDLMMMIFKYQLQNLVSPEHLLTLTANHLDGISALFSSDDNSIHSLLDKAHKMMISAYRRCQLWEFYVMRATLLSYFQDCRIKVSILIREKKQAENGHLILSTEELVVSERTDSPGCIKYFEDGILARSSEFSTRPPSKRIEIEKDDLSLGGRDRKTDLGKNIFRAGGRKGHGGGGGEGGVEDKGDEMALLSSVVARENVEEFQLALFDDESEMKEYQDAAKKENADSVTSIDAAANKKSLSSKLSEVINRHLKTSSGESTKKKAKGDDLLEMFDEAVARPATGQPKKRPSSKGKEKTIETVTPSQSRPSSKQATRPSSKDRPPSRGRSPSKETRPPSAKDASARPPSKGRPVSRDSTTERARSASVKKKAT